MKKTVFLTGAAGFIGGRLLTALKGNKVIKWEKEDYKPKWESKLFELFSEKKIDCLFHVGANSNTLDQDVNRVMFENYHTTRFLSNLAKHFQVPFIYSSSAACYGLDGKPANLYAWSKQCGEDIVLSNHQVALRYFNVIGETTDSKGPMSSVGWQAVKKHRNGDKITLFPGKPTRDFVYWRDVVNANLFAANNYDELIGKGWYDVGSGESRLFEDVISLLGFKYEYEKTNPLEGAGYQKFTLANSDKFMAGWKPKFDLENAILDWKNELQLK